MNDVALMPSRITQGGGLIRFPVSVFERGRTLGFADRVSEAIARSTKGGIAADAGIPGDISTGDGLSETRWNIATAEFRSFACPKELQR